MNSAGNSPAMIHQHYKRPATRKEAAAWFAVKPAKAPANIVNLPAAGGLHESKSCEHRVEGDSETKIVKPPTE